MIEFDFSPADAFIDSHVGSGLFLRAHAAHRALLEGTGAGSEWLGWRRILQDPNDALLEEITSVSREIRERADVLICIGIGGSYLGAKAIISALSPYFSSEPDGEEGVHAAPRVIFAGHHLSGSYLQELLDSLEGKSVFANVISKSGSTLEPAIAFRIIRKWMEDRFDDCSRRIIVTTDPDGGSLRELAQTNDYRTFDIPADIGGRFSALTPAGLFPVAVAGFDIRSLFYGSVAMMTELLSPEDNPAVAYAMSRYALHESGYTAEILSVFEPKLAGLGSWWQQLFAESEGKDLKGLFPTTCTYSGDLHSLGQYLQSGRRNLIETFLMIDSDRPSIEVPDENGSLDGLDFVAGKSIKSIAHAAFLGTTRAHLSGGVPVHIITMDGLTEENLGRLIYFFEHAVSVGGYLLGINPFDQPGVDAYKSEMLRVLGAQGDS